MKPRRISIVVPVCNEEGNLEPLLQEIRTVADSRQWDIEIIFVDDGSQDGSWRRIQALSAADPGVAGLRFQTNAGKAAALMAGFSVVRGDVVFMMDADQQDPPPEMPRMLDKLDGGADLVSGWKRVRHDPWHKVYPSRIFNQLISMATGVRLHDHVCGLKCFRRPVVRELRLYGEFHRFVGVLAASKGFRVAEIPTLHRPRTCGVGKYGFARFAKGFLDLITICCLTRYAWRPQHLIGVTGLWLTAILLTLRVLGWIVPWLAGPATTLVYVATPGLLLVAVGLVGQLIVDQRPVEEQYVVAERTGWCRTAAEVLENTAPA